MGKLLKLMVVLVVVIVGIVVIANKSDSTGAGGIPEVRLNKAYVAQMGRNASTNIFEFENTTDKPIEAFRGTFTAFDKFGKEVDSIDVEWTEVIPAKTKVWFHQMFIDERLNERKVKTAPTFLEGVAKQLNAKQEDMEINSKWQWKLKQAVPQ